MHFGVDFDEGHRVRLYLIPDSGGTTPSIVVSHEGVEVLRLQANENRSEVTRAGRHSTGQCGFILDTGLLPDLANMQTLEIIEPDSKLLLYRRPRPTFKQTRLFRLETHLLPLWRFDEALYEDFQYWFKGIDRFGRETAIQTFNLKNAESTYASGRLFMRMAEKFLARGLKAIALVRDPYDEIAERLIILKNIGEQRTELLGPRDAMTFDSVIAEIAEIETFDAASCKRFFKRAPSDVISLLSSPFARQLTVNNPNDALPQSCVGMALQTLSQFTVLGLRSEAKEFSKAVAEELEIEVDRLPVMREFAKVSELGNVLRQISEVESVLEHDLELYHHLKQAFGSAAEPAAPEAAG